ncbi:M48 family metallopeptidase [Paracoccus sp. M683]|uniref:M48 family metallopeptidase n=1 Tax=Paracoccus sp. M683 TaxID=2594268 RepID=UPI00117DD733|nr:M48 family metallopeptidase [Paracoccus sp. M683]TRW97555.1 M48 family metallopeptidase [Paracoccus sp. M683]
MCANSPSSRDFTRFRHRWEMPMIWLSVAITVLAFAIGLTLTLMGHSGLVEAGMTEQDATDLLDTSSFVLLLPLAPLAFFIYRFYMAAQAKSNAILVGPQQFPQLFALYQDLGQRLDMRRMPRLYLTNGNGVVNAYALECNRRNRYVVIHAEIAMLLPTAPDVVEFVLAHELAHHRLRHVSLWRIVIGMVPNLMLLPGLATTRAQEYSADRLAMAVCPNHALAVRLLAVGPWMHQGVDADAWAAQCEAEHREFWVRASNAMSSHAVMVKRYKALRDIECEGFARHGEMF